MGAGDYSGGVRIWAVIAVALVIGAGAWLLLRDGEDDAATGGGSAGSGPVATSEQGLARLSEKVGHPIYWVGEVDDAKLELTRTADGRVYVRYLVDGAAVGDPSAEFLTVGTYPFDDPYTALRKASKASGGVRQETPDGGIVVTNTGAPTSVYLAYPDSEVQVEVYDPDPDTALELATSGSVVPVGS